MPESSASYSSAFNPLELSFQRSGRLPKAILFVHIIATGALFSLGLPFFTLAVTLVGVLLSLIFSLSPWRSFGRDEIVTGLSWYPDEKVLVLVMADGTRLKVEETLTMAAVPGLISMSVITEKRVRPVWVVVTRDQLDGSNWRRLKVMVEWGGFPQREASGQG